mgnify:CR=1 FL=1
MQSNVRMNEYYSDLVIQLFKKDIYSELDPPEKFKNIVNNELDNYFQENEIKFPAEMKPIIRRKKGGEHQCIARVWLGSKQFKGYNDGSHQCTFTWKHKETLCCDKHHDKIMKNEWPFGIITDKLEQRVLYKGKYHIWDT